VKREQLEHVIRAACAVADDDEVVVIGSQAILAQFPDAPAELTQSLEADLYPRHHPERAELIDGALGELSMFHGTFGYYADGVSERTATLPAGWQDRLIPLRNQNTHGRTGLCLEVHDLLISKYVAGREKDRRFAAAAARHRLANRSTLLERLAVTDVDTAARDRIRTLIDRDHTEPAKGATQH
jgi:hypothetical protein